MRRFALCLVGVLIAYGCSSNDSTTTSGTQGTSTTGPGVGSGGNGSGGGITVGTGGSSTTTTTGSGGSGGMAVCPAGTVICDGNVAKICNGNGGFTSQTDCASQVCVPDLGCVNCIPGTAQCNGDTSIICQPDGMSTVEEDCDPLQGVSCDPNSGLCVGDCAPQAIGKSYQGCDYYPTITANPLLTTKNVVHYAVAIANTTTSQANVIVTKGATTVTSTTIAANSVLVLPLPWIAALDGQTTAKVTDGAYRLRTDKPVTVYQYNPLEYTASGSFTYTNDASLLLPVNAWTGTYRVMSRNQWRFTSSTSYPGLYAVTASQDNTTVTLTPSATGGNVSAGAGVAANGTGTVTLNEGDVLQVMTTATTSSGLVPPT